MINRSPFCADAGTVNCPCPLADTGDCLVCGKLSGRGECACEWAGVCVYNEYIQNGGIVRSRRESREVRVLDKILCEDNILLLTIEVSRGFALEASRPGSFLFVKTCGADSFANVPVSVMRADADKGEILLALKVISAKTKAVACAEDRLEIRGVYRNGLLGRGLAELYDRRKKKVEWLVITKGIGLAPAINTLRWTGGGVRVKLLVDTDKINGNFLRGALAGLPEAVRNEMSVETCSLAKLVQSMREEPAGAGESAATEPYDSVLILASDYYIKTLAELWRIPREKLVYSNNFRMCCGEGICGACGHIGRDGGLSKMCKCRCLDAAELM